MLRLRTFGGLALEGAGSTSAGAGTQPKCLALLALLASAGERPTSRDKVLAYFWPETEPAKAAHRLAQVLYALRHDLEAETLFRGPSDLRLNPQIIGSDVQDFTEALERGELGKAVALYQGTFLDGFYLTGAGEFERWVETERADYARKYCAALESLATAASRRGDASEAAESWRRLAESEPLNSRVAVLHGSPQRGWRSCRRATVRSRSRETFTGGVRCRARPSRLGGGRADPDRAAGGSRGCGGVPAGSGPGGEHRGPAVRESEPRPGERILQ